jgi:2-oxo-3-hexenedioate decarboxylase
MRNTPPPKATLDQLLDCIEWVAPGFEIVQSHAPDWKFNAAMTVADGGLHSRLLVGSKIDVKTLAKSAQAFNEVLAHCQIALQKNGVMVERGQGRNVLDGPILALQYFLAELRQCQGAPDLMPGDVITTGTWTDAWPVQAGDTWRAEFDAPLSALSVTFT